MFQYADNCTEALMLSRTAFFSLYEQYGDLEKEAKEQREKAKTEELAKNKALEAGIPQDKIEIFPNPYHNYIRNWKPADTKIDFFLNNYKNAINLKVGSELKLSNAWLARAGAAYYGSPYKDNSISASIMSISGGLGYRMGNHLIDFTIMNISSKDALFPYRLIDKDNYYAEQKSNRIILSIGYGIKF